VVSGGDDDNDGRVKIFDRKCGRLLGPILQSFNSSENF
jgi:hypothetical protein